MSFVCLPAHIASDDPFRSRCCSSPPVSSPGSSCPPPRPPTSSRSTPAARNASSSRCSMPLRQIPAFKIELLSSGTTELVNRLKAEGDRTSADLLITNDAGSLELARTAGLLRPLNMREVERAIPAQFRAPDNAWVGLSGRFWIVVYNTHDGQAGPSEVAPRPRRSKMER